MLYANQEDNNRVLEFAFWFFIGVLEAIQLTLVASPIIILVYPQYKEAWIGAMAAWSLAMGYFGEKYV